MKKSISVVGALILALNFMALSFSASAQETVGGGSGEECKWAIMDCSGGTSREICVTDGDGNACTCGTVTRPC